MEVREGVALNRSFSFAALIVFAPTESSQIAYRGWDSQVSKSARPGPPGGVTILPTNMRREVAAFVQWRRICSKREAP